MAAVSLAPADLAPFATIDEAKAQAMIDTALARAARIAPCILDETLDANSETAARGVIRDAILRWNDAGSGAVESQTAGPFGVQIDTRQERRSLFSPSEIEELQAICRDFAGAGEARAFTIDTTPAAASTDGYWSTTDVWTELP